MGIKSRLKELWHWHKFTTLLIYPPQCARNDTYGFLLYCNCGYTKPTNIPYSVKKTFEVKGNKYA